MASKRFALRTVHAGAVRINGKTFRPRDESATNGLPYADQLEGMRLAFGLYPGAFPAREMVSLWGTETAYCCQHDHDADGTEHCDWPGPNCIDGVFQWNWWVES